MQVFKFGGASVKDAKAIKSIASIVKQFDQDQLIVVVSATGKTTNKLEKVVEAYTIKQKSLAIKLLNEVVAQHQLIVKDLTYILAHQTLEKIKYFQEELVHFMEGNRSNNYTYIYDQIVPIGELLSTTIVSDYFKCAELKNEWLDARDIIKTDRNYSEANVDFSATQSAIKDALIENQNIYVTQGFIGSTDDGITTTLGREGSDYSAAVLAYCTDAEQVTVWKDVQGILNADPTVFDETTLLKELPYNETIEMTYYGAKIIHPNTIKPLQNKNIPMVVRSFLNPELEGTVISKAGDATTLPPVFVYKQDQVMLRFFVKDFSFVSEENLALIFKAFGDNRLRINLMQNKAISFTACVDDKVEKLERIVKSLENDFRIEKTEGVSLLTIRHYTDEIFNKLTEGKELLVVQKSESTIQTLMK